MMQQIKFWRIFNLIQFGKETVIVNTLCPFTQLSEYFSFLGNTQGITLMDIWALFTDAESDLNWCCSCRYDKMWTMSSKL
jgi:hypothetical protein